jgi:hypothetical protein
VSGPVNQVRDFAPIEIGMLESWVLASGSERIMQCWINVPATDGINDKIKMAYILLKTNIPVFHHSIIPF